MGSAFLFPGQGAQTVGMAAAVCAEVPAAKELFDRAAAVLGYDLLAVCADGPAERLNATDVSQPALYVAGLAAVEKLRADDPDAVESCTHAAGLSLGEYTALAFAGAFSFEDGLRVVHTRGTAMQAAAEKSPGAMSSILGLEPEGVEELCTQATEGDDFVRVANYLCPKNYAVSGTATAVERVEKLATEAGALKTVRLAVAGAFHTSLMEPADKRLAEALVAVKVKPPRLAVVSNVDGAEHSDPDEIRTLLVEQVLQPVLWEKSLRHLLETAGCERFFELGPGRVLAGLMKRVHRKADMTNVTV